MLKTKNKNLILFVSLILIAFTTALFFNMHTPLIADDFNYILHDHFFKFTDIRFKHFVDIFVFQFHHYFTWGGRTIVHLFAQFSLLFGKNIFNFTNSLMYVWFTLLIYFHINGFKKVNPMLYLLINVFVFIINPAFGQTTFWLVGASNYLWGTSFILTFTLPFRLYYEKQFSVNKKLFIPFISIIGLMAGWSNENTSGAGVLIAISFFILIKYIQKRKVESWMYVGIAFAILGLALLVLAPGNYARGALFESTRMMRITRTFQVLKVYFVPYMLGLVALFILQVRTNKDMKYIYLTLLYSLAFLAANFAMMVAPDYPERATHGVSTLLIIALGIAYVNINNKDLTFGINLFSIAIIYSMAVLLLNGAKDTRAMFIQSSNRQTQILNDRSNGIYDIETFMLHPQTRFNPMYGINDIQEDPYFWINKDMSRYYDINSIRVVTDQ